MNCKEWLERLYQILDRDLNGNVWNDVERHMKDCRSCWDRFEFEKVLKEKVKNSCKDTCAESLRVRIKALFEKY